MARRLPSSIDIRVALDDGRITEVDVTPRATDPTSRDLQERFAEAVPEVVIGRPIGSPLPGVTRRAMLGRDAEGRQALVPADR